MTTITFAETADAAQVGRLFLEDMQDLGVAVTLDQMVELANDSIAASLVDHPSCLIWVARHAELGVVGVLLANLSWSLKFAGRAIWIEELYVTPAARRTGLGRLLVETLLDHAEEHDLKGIDLEAYQGNTPASILYRSLGFRRLGRERFYYRTDGLELFR